LKSVVGIDRGLAGPSDEAGFRLVADQATIATFGEVIEAYCLAWLHV
jgi:hypothetical protein